MWAVPLATICSKYRAHARSMPDHLQTHGTYCQDVAVREWRVGAHAGVIHTCAIGASQVSHDPGAADATESGVFGGHGGVGDDQVRSIRTTKSRGVVEVDKLARA